MLKNFFPARERLKEPKHHYNALSWKDVDWLLMQGHVVGAHAKQHQMLSTLTARQQKEEIIESANRMECKLGIKVSSFAYPFGSVSSVNADAISIAAQRFQCSFSNVRGSIVKALVITSYFGKILFLEIHFGWYKRWSRDVLTGNIIKSVKLLCD